MSIENQPSKNTMSAEELISRSDLQRRLDVSSETIRRWLRSGTLPEPDVRLSRKTVAWRASTLTKAGIRLV